MAVSVRELFLIVRAQNQASNTLKGVSRDLRGLSESARLAEERSRLADKAMQLENTRKAVRGNIGQAFGEVQQIQGNRVRLQHEYNDAIKATDSIQKASLAT